MSLDWLWFAVILKLPLVALVLLAWWAIRQEPDDAPSQDDDGGTRRSDERERPLRPFPRHPRRGPHGDPPPPSPSRIRTVQARARSLGH